MEKIRWGILSTGNIATRFVSDLLEVEDAEVTAVASRSQDTADLFGNQFGIRKRYGRYEDLIADESIDVIYIGTPHPFHKENALACLRAGKAVLCEKPIALNFNDAIEMRNAAFENQVFFMEAMWSRFIPATEKVLEIINEGLLGEIRLLRADFGYNAEFNPASRIYSPDLAGGALLDVGIYPITLAHLILGMPETILSQVTKAETGVDAANSMIFQYENGAMAMLYSAINTHTTVDAEIMGSRGLIRIHRRWHHSQRLTLVIDGEKRETIEIPYAGNGYRYEAMEVNRCLREGKLESPKRPIRASLEVLKIMDQLRQSWGLVYPQEL
ncbi:Gfo/Idh/MocA family oxidoreductase [Anaerolineales bacterium]